MQRKPHARSRAKDDRELASLRDGIEPTVDAARLYLVAEPRPHERAVLLLAEALTPRDDRWCIAWKYQEQAAAFYNEHGLARTLDRIAELDPSLL